jgi:hypothetical protein
MKRVIRTPAVRKASATRAPPTANKIIRSPLARRDLIDIWQFIADDNETAADRQLDRIENSG